MAKGNIDPAMQAAPFLGESSHDPIEFSRRQTMVKYQRNMQRRAENQRNIAKGLDNLTLDLKDLYGERGVNEVLGDQARAKEAFIKLQTSGVNVFSPTTPLEIKAYQAIMKTQEESMKKVDVMTANKKILELQSKAAFEDSKLPKEKQVYDQEATKANIEAARKFKGGVLETQSLYDNLLIKNPTMGNVDKYTDDNKERITQVMVDPVTGKPNAAQEAQQAKDYGNLFDRMPEPEMRALKAEKARNPVYDVVPLKDYYIANYSDAARGKLTRQLQETDTESKGVPFSFLHASGKIIPGEHQVDNIQYGGRNFNERYDFSFPVAKTFFIPPAGGEYSTENSWEPIPAAGGPIEGNLLFYDPQTDALLFKVSQDARYPWIKNNTTISIPRKNLAKSDELPIMVDGKKKTLKDILPGADPKAAGRNSVLKNSGISWK
ncbi:MAG: hypothetical protein JJE45_00485 [Prolixibacteraceae bacterium]|nr:hypothetical protein [Prolixibacteraceae bacterium]